jgi:E3 ubiquitin-protein ligase HUWE1
MVHSTCNCCVILTPVSDSRFTKDNVIVTAPTKVKSGCDLQLPSMSTLTSKTSSQAFFLRILKVIVQIRESVRLAYRRNRESSGKFT